MPEFRHIRVDVPEKGILLITIDRPEALNAIHDAAHRELERVFDRYTADPDLRVAIITGAGERSFCVGSDLKAKSQKSYRADENPRSGFAGITSRFDLCKPVIAAVNGYAFGGGLEIVLACDLVVAVSDAMFCFPEPLVGQAALSGGIQRLVRHIPYKRAMQMLLTCERVGAQAAYDLGFINQVVDRPALIGSALAMARSIIRGAPLAIECTKAVAMRAFSDSVERSIVDHHQAALTMLLSSDAHEGPLAFTEKRAPCWTGS
jgi:enoyl-CoA hydratase/carnithine racemase